MSVPAASRWRPGRTASVILPVVIGADLTAAGSEPASHPDHDPSAGHSVDHHCARHGPDPAAGERAADDPGQRRGDNRSRLDHEEPIERHHAARHHQPPGRNLLRMAYTPKSTERRDRAASRQRPRRPDWPDGAVPPPPERAHDAAILDAFPVRATRHRHDGRPPPSHPGVLGPPAGNAPCRRSGASPSRSPRPGSAPERTFRTPALRQAFTWKTLARARRLTGHDGDEAIGANGGLPAGTARRRQ
jgi:hypothetical protein